ncbi:Bcr/CflA family efflux MFS transporter [Aquicoccus sp. SCR17]|nr:Bcr/CflA family efflux MFS transporter [Carideicomes alvinocaridis]
MSARISRVEFVAMMAMSFATIAITIDAMLPAVPEITETLSPNEPNKVQLIITLFMLGMGLGTLFVGPISDAVGRKPVILGGAALYIASALVAWQSRSLEVLLIARFFQGMGASGPRVVTLAVVRDLFDGRDMARIMSFVLTVFTLVPAIAPLMGSGIIALAGWRAIFLAFVLFSVISTAWILLRLDEPLEPARRRPFRASSILSAVKEVISTPEVRVSIGVQALIFGMMFSMLSSVQMIYDLRFGHNDLFPWIFGGIALLAGCSSMINAAIVMKIGMRTIVTAALSTQVCASAIMIVTCLLTPPDTVFFVIFVCWQATVFLQLGFTMGNINAFAMEPMGHIAGLAASIIAAIGTVIGVVIAIPVGLAFDGTPLPLAGGIFVFAVLAVLLMRRLRHIHRKRAEAPAE